MNKSIFLIGTRWFGILGPTKEIIEKLVSEDYDVYVFGQKDNRYHRYFFKNLIIFSPSLIGNIIFSTLSSTIILLLNSIIDLVA